MATIICPKCGQENPDGTTFCVACGAKLDVTFEASPETDSQESVDYDAEQKEEPKQGFFRKPGGKALIIVIIVAVVAVAVVAVVEMYRPALPSEEDASTVAGADEENTIIASIWPGERYECDLDGDGVMETVGIVEDAIESEYVTVSLLINGEVRDTITYVYSGVGVIVDIDTSDNTLQIGVQYTTDGDDMGTVFYNYDSVGIHRLNGIPGGFYDTGDFPPMVCPGDGTIQSLKSLSIFETWFASVTWMLRDGEIVELVPPTYEPLDLFDGCGIDLTVLQSINVREGTPDGDSMILPAGTKVHMKGTDNQNWVCMTAEGYEGTLYLWLSGDGWYVWPEGASESVPTTAVFDNMSNFN